MKSLLTKVRSLTLSMVFAFQRGQQDFTSIVDLVNETLRIETSHSDDEPRETVKLPTMKWAPLKDRRKMDQEVPNQPIEENESSQPAPSTHVKSSGAVPAQEVKN